MHSSGEQLRFGIAAAVRQRCRMCCFGQTQPSQTQLIFLAFLISVGESTPFTRRCAPRFSVLCTLKPLHLLPAGPAA